MIWNDDSGDNTVRAAQMEPNWCLLFWTDASTLWTSQPTWSGTASSIYRIHFNQSKRHSFVSTTNYKRCDHVPFHIILTRTDHTSHSWADNSSLIEAPLQLLKRQRYFQLWLGISDFPDHCGSHSVCLIFIQFLLWMNFIKRARNVIMVRWACSDRRVWFPVWAPVLLSLPITTLVFPWVLQVTPSRLIM